MSLFIDKHNRRKSTLALAAFGAALLYLCIFGLLYAVLAKPLYDHVRLGSPRATMAAHSAVISLAGTALCCLLFILKDKRVAPWGFAGLGILLCMFYAAAFLLDPSARRGMLWLISIYGLPPVLVGNAAAWSVYLKIRRGSPAPEHRKTIQQELEEAAAQEVAKRGRKGKTPPEAPPAPPREADSRPPAPFGPESGGGPGSSRSEEEEAMLLYMDDSDEESDD